MERLVWASEYLELACQQNIIHFLTLPLIKFFKNITCYQFWNFGRSKNEDWVFLSHHIRVWSERVNEILTRKKRKIWNLCDYYGTVIQTRGTISTIFTTAGMFKATAGMFKEFFRNTLQKPFLKCSSKLLIPVRCFMKSFQMLGKEGALTKLD